jgi:hypothetical protein
MRIAVDVDKVKLAIAVDAGDFEEVRLNGVVCLIRLQVRILHKGWNKRMRNSKVILVFCRSLF